MMSEAIPRLTSYAEAKAYAASVVPYKTGADKAGKKPLGKVRRYNRSLIEDRGDVVACTLYETDVVLFRADGSIVLGTGGYSSVMTGMFLCDLLGFSRIERRSGRIYYVDNNSYMHLINPTVTIHADGKVTGRTIEARYVPVRGALAARRKEYLPFLDYAKQVLAVSPEFELDAKLRVEQLCISSSELRWRRNRSVSDPRDRFFDGIKDALTITDEEKRLSKLYSLLRQGAISWGVHSRAHDEKVICGYAKFSKSFNELLRYHHAEELFVKEEVPLSKKFVQDKNHKYVAAIPLTFGATV